MPVRRNKKAAAALGLACGLAGAQVPTPDAASQVLAAAQQVEIAGHYDNGVGTSDAASQAIGTLGAIAWALASGFVVYGLLKRFVGRRLSQEEEFEGADLSIHRIGATPEREVSW